MPGDWSRAEIEATVADYRHMLAAELSGEDFNKAEHNRNLQRLLNGRTHGSIERKHQNISAIMIELGYAWIDGYKPLRNYHGLLLDIVEQQIASDHVLLALMKQNALAAASPPQGMPGTTQDVLDTLEEPPEPGDRVPYLDRVMERRNAMPRLNYLELEASNAAQGQAGEEWVLRFERARLTREGRESLADRIEWVSRDQGDYLGFDIRSFERDGTDRFVEVKTTKLGKQTPFFVSRNEVRVSRDKDRAYHLYRVFRFQRGPKLYVLPGALERSCSLDPTEYEARVG